MFKRDGDHMRRVVAVAGAAADLRDPPDPSGCSSTARVVICAGGGGIPTTFVPGKERTLVGVEAVIDKDLASELLAREIEADLFVMATDVDGVYEDWGTPEQRKLDRVTPERAARATLRRRLDGAQGRGGRAVRGAHRRRAPPSARWPTSSRSSRAPPAPTSVPAEASRRIRTDERVRCPLRGRQAAQGDGPPTGPQPAAADAVEPRRAAVRRRAVGRAGPVRARPVRRPDARARRRGVPPVGPARRDAGGERRGAARG